MPHVSNKKIDDKYFNEIYDQLISIFDTAGSGRRSDVFLKEFLTETEKVMFAKRLAVLFMLSEGVSKHFISEILLVSPSTVDRISLQFEQDKYPYLSLIIEKNQEDIWDSIENIITAGLPKKIGKGRWQWLEEIERKQKRKIFKN